jgi:hypothetical protein
VSSQFCLTVGDKTERNIRPAMDVDLPPDIEQGDFAMDMGMDIEYAEGPFLDNALADLPLNLLMDTTAPQSMNERRSKTPVRLFDSGLFNSHFPMTRASLIRTKVRFVAYVRSSCVLTPERKYAATFYARLYQHPSICPESGQFCPIPSFSRRRPRTRDCHCQGSNSKSCSTQTQTSPPTSRC